MIHHNTPASEIKIKCIEKRSHKGKKAKVSRFLRDSSANRQNTPPWDNWSKEQKPSYTRYSFMCSITPNIKKTLSLRPGRRSNNNRARLHFAQEEEHFYIFLKKKNSKKAKRMREWMLRRWWVRRRHSCSSDLPKLAIIWNWNIISVGSFNQKPSEGLDVKKFHLQWLIKLNGQKKEQ